MKYIIGGLAIIAIVLLIVFWKPISAFFFSENKPADGTPCTDVAGRSGTYTNGVCTAEGGPGPVVETRYVYVNPAPNTLLLPSLNYSNCSLYNSANPYRANGCSYIFAGYTWMRRTRFCVLRKISCP